VLYLLTGFEGRRDNQSGTGHLYEFSRAYSVCTRLKPASWDLSFTGKWQHIAFPGGCLNLA